MEISGWTVAVGAISGIIGASLGAWLSSIFTLRRERWGLQRELYRQLLENLGEVKDALEHELEFFESEPSGKAPKETIDAWTQRRETHFKRRSSAEDRLRLATWTASFMLPKEVSEALHNFKKESRVAAECDSYDDYINEKILVTNKTYELLINAARRDLGFSP
jgi:hypothetical protein